MDPKTYLSKSDFKSAQECAAKLRYRKLKYPTLENEYLDLLAEGGYMIGKMAQILYPGGIEIKEGNPEKAIELTAEYMGKDKITLFEPAFFNDGKLVRVDILVKRGSEIDLIEVKAKSIDSSKLELISDQQQKVFCFPTKKNVPSKYVPYVEDAAFQTLTLQELYPNAKIRTFLLMTDKVKTTTIDALIACFKLSSNVANQGSFRSYQVEFDGDADQLRKDHILSLVDVTDRVAVMKDHIKNCFTSHLEHLKGNFGNLSTMIGTHCKECEYCTPKADKNGFKECWGELADVQPHFLDLYYIGTLGGKKNPVAPELIRQGKVSLFDVPMDRFTEKIGKRQKLQIEMTRKNQEWIDPELKTVLSGLKYPLHFIDFETSRMAIPYHASMRPYGLIAFQWSCHTIPAPGAPIVHSEWINIDNVFPNFEFAKSLKAQIGSTGSVLTWSHHENSVLKDIAESLSNSDQYDAELAAWLEEIAPEEKKDSSRIVDLNKLTLEHYFHPDMKGRTSIKVVLPAIWMNFSYLHKMPEFEPYYRVIDGKTMDPYHTLPPFEIFENAEVVKDGTGAMRAYQEMLYGLSRDNAQIRKKWKSLLLQYCALDTMAMIIIWTHWMRSFGLIGERVSR